MAIGHHPSIFISSTCYDLAQVRKDLRAFVEAIGMTAIMSEHNSFPIDPNIDAVNNCLGRVKGSADVFVLVVGGRYGSQTDAGKSVTNLEYDEAKAKGIPRYVFVEKGILTTLPVWDKSPTADFSAIVDSPKLFEFVHALRDPKENWVFPFESAQDIIDTLRNQLAYLFKDALDIRLKVTHAGIPDQLQDLSGVALAIAILKPFAWEYRLFSQVYTDELLRCSGIKRDLKYGITLGRGVRLTNIEMLKEWVQSKMSEILSFVQSVGKIVNVALPTALGPPGQPGNVEAIVYVGQRLGLVYRRLLEWTSEFKHADAEEDFSAVLSIIARASQNLISELEDLSQSLQAEVLNAVSKYEITKERQSVEITLKLTCPDMTDLDEELRKLAASHGGSR